MLMKPFFKENMMAVLAEMKCTVCRAGDTPLDKFEITQYRDQVPDWEIVREDGIDKVRRVFKFNDFASALAFTQAVGDLAEQEGHHPVITLQWGKVSVVWWTHEIRGLHPNDFIMAARSDQAYKEGHFEKPKR
jgi:4a-hydroxytetrahydrobiopterin dehydratase